MQPNACIWLYPSRSIDAEGVNNFITDSHKEEASAQRRLLVFTTYFAYGLVELADTAELALVAVVGDSGFPVVAQFSIIKFFRSRAIESRVSFSFNNVVKGDTQDSHNLRTTQSSFSLR